MQMIAPDPALAASQTVPRAHGVADVQVRRDAGAPTRLSDLRQSGALKVVFPRADPPDMTGVLVNTAGGLTGGDTMSVTARLAPAARLTLTTQAAERAYRAASGVARVQTQIKVDAGAHLNWLPQETILFDGCSLNRHLHVSLAQDATALIVEPLIFGRRAMGEALEQLALRDRITVMRAGQPLYLDQCRLMAPQDIRRLATCDCAGAAVQLICVAPNAPLLAEQIKRFLPATGGVSAITEDLLVMRCVADDGFALRQTLLPILDALTHQRVPTCWRL